ncbi:MAG: 50S ribosomal protein L6 [Methanomassiliicoccaceae archaeon]|nr:50S ribosomal protein L6 [Methanomassiliicoccaceae archaeon]MCL2145674.1 50S ribosomal protein L6 [Methanomassiliicoccaceae archaeon]
MTIAGKIESTIAIPGGVSVSMSGNTVKVKGPRGELSRNFAYPRVSIAIGEGTVIVSSEYPRTKDKAMVGTFAAHINNMIKGVTIGFTYTLKIVFSHFPMKVAVKDNRVEINNYMGGHAPRYANIVGGCKVTISGADVTVEGNSIEACGQTAANIERATSRLGFDKRIFQDGIYLVHRSQKVKE